MRAAVKMEGHETPDWNNYYSEAPEVGPLFRFLMIRVENYDEMGNVFQFHVNSFTFEDL